MTMGPYENEDELIQDFQMLVDQGRLSELQEPHKPLFQAAVREGLVKVPALPTWLVAAQAYKNLPASTARYGADIFSAVASPIQTAKSVLDLGQGIVNSLFPNISKATGIYDEEKDKLAREVGKNYVQKYGSVQGFQQAFMNDPATVLSDVSAVLGAGSYALPTRYSGKVRDYANALEPINAAITTVRGTAEMVKSVPYVREAVQGIQNLPAEIVGVTTGAGRRPVQEAFRAGKEGGTRGDLFISNMRKLTDPLQVLEAAKRNISALQQKMQQQYRQGMVDIRNDKTILDFDTIDQSMMDSLDRFTFKGVSKNPEAARRVKNVGRIIDAWKKQDPQRFHTPEGLDALKQRVGAELEKIDPQRNPTAYGAVREIYDGIWQTIQSQSPTYASVMKDYQNMANEIMDMRRTLSLDNKATVDTAMRKLLSSMRDNVNTNFGQRTRLVEDLESGGDQLIPQLAGQTMTSWVPRGIQGAAAGTIVPAALYTNPAALAGLPLQSPRLMGEVAYGAGVASRRLPEWYQRTPEQLRNPQLRNILYQAEQVREENQ